MNTETERATKQEKVKPQETRLSEQYVVTEEYLRSIGFTQDRINHIMFMQWLAQQGKIKG